LCLALLLPATQLVVSCGTTGQPHHIRNSPSYYHVRRGDTLYTLAWRFSVDVRDLIGWNRIKPPYTIYPGQKLVMSPPPGYRRPVERTVQRQVASRQPAPAARPPVASRGGSVATPSPKPASPVVAKPVTSPPSKPPAAAKPAASKPSPHPAVPAEPPVSHPVAAAIEMSARRLAWVWPLQGRVISHFNAALPGRQGIEIQGSNGQPVKAAEAGKVVYSGNALKGYGELIIIQHSADYLSAYAHNRKRLVEEGRIVRRGEKIAELGDRYTNAPILHFEVRYKGKPVNPLRYLPGSRP
jgi:lipoprotein NlpD